MRRCLAALIALVMLLGAALVAAPPAAAGADSPCSGSEVEVRGRVTDAATGLALDEVTSVGVHRLGGADDGIGTNAASRWATCVLPGDYKFSYFADNYRVEWHNDQPDEASATVVTIAGPGPVIVNAALTPNGRVIAGRVTNMSGVAKSASVDIWRRTATGWRSIDGIGNHMPSGRWSFRVPGLGRYRVAAFVDHHRARWHESAARLRVARVVVVTAATTFITGVDIRVPYCPGPSDDFCVPPGFFS